MLSKVRQKKQKHRKIKQGLKMLNLGPQNLRSEIKGDLGTYPQIHKCVEVFGNANSLSGVSVNFKKYTSMNG